MFTDASDRRTFTDRRLVVGAVGGFDLKRDSGERGGWLVEKNWKISAVFLALVVLGGCGGVERFGGMLAGRAGDHAGW
jgi:hypothetical protein